jgi:hypothetical protein
MVSDRAWLLSALLSLLLTLAGSQGWAQTQPRAFLGIGLADIPGGGGAVVGVIAPGSPAERAGLQIRDLVTAVNGSAVARAAEVTDAVLAMRPGDTAHLAVLRGRGAAAQQLSIDVTLGTSPGASAPAAPNSADSAASEPKPAAALPGRNHAPTAAAASPRPLAVEGYTNFSDPLEQAFTIQVPVGWSSVGGLARRSALQINPFLRSVSPDKMTYLMIGEPVLPSYVPPTPLRNTLGYREGKLFDSGLGGLSMVLHFMRGTEFAQAYGQTVLSGLCTAVRYQQSAERQDMAQSADRLVPTVIPSLSSGGEARFSCTHNGQPMEARIEVVTRTTRDNVMWNVIFLKGWLAPRTDAERAEEILTHVGASLAFDPAWLQKQSNLDQQAANSINRSMQEFFRRQQAVVQKLNAVDTSFSSMDEIVSGYSTYHDAATGQDYKLDNTNPYKWIDNSTSRIFSTPNNIPPPWGGALAPLAHLAQ